MLKLLPFLLVACAAPDVARFPVVDGREGDYALIAAEIPELADPVAMEGALGNGTVGGYLDLDSGRYEGGGAIEVRFEAQGDLAVPLHDDAIVLWTYYHTLSRVRVDLAALGIDVEPIFPIPFAYQPVIGGAALTASNAAYAGGGSHFFVLLSDPPAADLPLAANPGVIRHEFGHALFQQVVGGDVDEGFPLDEDPDVRSLNEGFADAVATISLDDADGFWVLGLPGSVAEARRTDRVRTIEGVAKGALDPYDRGSVFASLAWALREQTDPDTALLLVVEALRQWALESEDTDLEGTDLVDRWAELLVAVSANDVDLCPAYEERFLEPCP